MDNVEKFLDWLVALDIQHYKTGTATPSYTPRGESHFYLKGSRERFTSIEMIKIFNNQADDDLSNRWNSAVVDKI